MEDTTMHRRPGRIRRALRRLLSLAVALTVFSIFYLVTFGFPEWLRDETLTRISKGEFAIFASAMRLDPVHGIAMKEMKVFRKGVVGPAALQAENVAISVNIMELLSGKFRVRELVVRDGEFRPPMLHCPGREAARRSVVPMDIRVRLSNFLVQGLTVDRVSFRLCSYGKISRYENISGVVGTGPMAGAVTGEIAFDASTCMLTGHLTSEFDLHALVPIFRAWEIGAANWVIQKFDFGRRNPRCEVDFTKLCTEEGKLTVDGRFWTENSTYCGVEMLRADGRLKADISGTNSWIAVDPVLVVRSEGVAKGSFTVRPSRRRIEFNGTSTLDPREACRLIGVLTNGVLALCEFGGGVKVDGEGVATFGLDPPAHDFTLEVDGRDLGLGPLLVEKYSFTSTMNGISNTFSNVRGRLYGGDFQGAARIALPTGSATSVWYELEGDAAGIDFGKFVHAFHRDDKKDYSGKLWVKGELSGFAGKGNGKTARGHGEIGVNDGRVFMLPIFGGLSSLMVKIIPGLDFVLRQSDAQADFIIGDGRIHSKKVKIEGDILSLQGRGDCGLDGSLNYEAQLKLMKEHTLVGKLLRGATWLLTKLFEFRLAGTLSDPKWYPENFSSDLLKKLGLKRDGVEERKVRKPE